MSGDPMCELSAPHVCRRRDGRMVDGPDDGACDVWARMMARRSWLGEDSDRVVPLEFGAV